MNYIMFRGIGVLGLLFAVCLICPGGAVAQRSPEATLAIVDGTARGLALAGITKVQHDKALANWRLQFAKETPPSTESSRFLLYGSIAGKKDLKDVGAALDKQYVVAAKALGAEHEDPWPGKMAIYFYEQRLYFSGFCRQVEKRKLEEDESGTFDIDSDFPHAAAMPPTAKGELPADLQAGAQMAAAAMFKKTGSKAPSWLLHAFGRAVVLKTSSPAMLAADRRKAYTLIFKQKRTLKDVLGNSLPDEEGRVLRSNLMEYLALSGKLARFPQFCKGFEPSDDVPEPTIMQALEKAEYTTDKLDTAWQNWVKTVK